MVKQLSKVINNGMASARMKLPKGNRLKSPFARKLAFEITQGQLNAKNVERGKLDPWDLRRSSQISDETQQKRPITEPKQQRIKISVQTRRLVSSKGASVKKMTMAKNTGTHSNSSGAEFMEE